MGTEFQRRRDKLVAFAHTEGILGLLIVGCELKRAGDLVDEAGELLGGLGGNSLDVALEDKEVLGLDEDVVLDEGGVVRGVGHVPVVELVLGRAGGRDSTTNRLKPSY